MPLNKKPLPIEPTPESVAQARRWVATVLQELDRHDLVDSAELGVSELVTNAILHADPPILVRVRGTRAHPRVEVRDHSQHPPRINPDMTDEDSLLSTIGRGLGIVALYSTTWGSEVGPEGKTVWFEPSSDLQEAEPSAGEVFDFAQFVERRVAKAPRPANLVRIRLVGMPVQVFAAFRSRYNELRRELQLLAISHGDEYPLAREFAELVVQVEEERRLSRGAERLDELIASGEVSADLEYDVPPTAPETMARMSELMDQAEEFCRDQRLLALAATPQQLDLQHWYFGEFARQGAGEEPRPWRGSYSVEPAESLR